MYCCTSHIVTKHCWIEPALVFTRADQQILRRNFPKCDHGIQSQKLSCHSPPLSKRRQMTSIKCTYSKKEWYIILTFHLSFISCSIWDDISLNYIFATIQWEATMIKRNPQKHKVYTKQEQIQHLRKCTCSKWLCTMTMQVWICPWNILNHNERDDHKMILTEQTRIIFNTEIQLWSNSIRVQSISDQIKHKWEGGGLSLSHEKLATNELTLAARWRAAINNIETQTCTWDGWVKHCWWLALTIRGWALANQHSPAMFKACWASSDKPSGLQQLST